VALAWLLAQGDDIVLIPGTKHVSRMEENAAATGITLAANQLARLGAIQAPVGDRYADMSRINRQAPAAASRRLSRRPAEPVPVPRATFVLAGRGPTSGSGLNSSGVQVWSPWVRLHKARRETC
jgi:hypothetical protein